MVEKQKLEQLISIFKIFNYKTQKNRKISTYFSIFSFFSSFFCNYKKKFYKYVGPLWDTFIKKFSRNYEKVSSQL